MATATGDIVRPDGRLLECDGGLSDGCELGVENGLLNGCMLGLSNS